MSSKAESERTSKSIRSKLRSQRLAQSADGLREAGSKSGADAGSTVKLANQLYMNVSGRVESAHIRGHDQLMCSYEFVYGPDWRLQDTPTSTTCDSQYSVNVPTRAGATSVWNFPLSATFTSTNVHGWPRLVITLCDNNLVARGYGVCYIPPYPGHYLRYIHIFTPLASAPVQDFLGWLLNAPPEFRESKFTAQNNDREVTRVQSSGVVKVVLNVATRNFEEFGYTSAPQTNDASKAGL
eukprot:g14.t1